MKDIEILYYVEYLESTYRKASEDLENVANKMRISIMKKAILKKLFINLIIMLIIALAYLFIDYSYIIKTYFVVILLLLLIFTHNYIVNKIYEYDKKKLFDNLSEEFKKGIKYGYFNREY